MHVDMKELEEMADATGMDCLLMRQGEDDVAEFWNASRDQLLALANAIEAKVTEACALACEAIETDKWALFKGRPPYTGREPGRASDYTQGESGGAAACADAIRARGATDGNVKA